MDSMVAFIYNSIFFSPLTELFVSDLNLVVEFLMSYLYNYRNMLIKV